MLYWLLLSSCDPAVDACDGMCQAAANAQEACLSEWEAQWVDFGYADKPDYLNACDTWAWEMDLLQKDAQPNDATSTAQEICLERHNWLGSETFTCESWLSIDWNETPWTR